MRAAVLYEHGAVENLKFEPDYREPKPGKGEVLIKVKASSLNYHDVFTCRGMPGIKVPLPIDHRPRRGGRDRRTRRRRHRLEDGRPGAGQPDLSPAEGLMGEMLDGGLAEYCVCAAEPI